MSRIDKHYRNQNITDYVNILFKCIKNESFAVGNNTILDYISFMQELFKIALYVLLSSIYY